MKRIIGAFIRALIVVLIIALPAYLLPDVGKTTQELALIIGAIVGAFTMFEYGGKTPGFFDFRFAPPYNRFRIAIIAAQVIGLSLLCRATIQGIPEILELADRAVQYASFPFSPVEMAVAQTASLSLSTSPELILQLFSTSFVIAAGLAIGLSAVLWIFGWPTGRSDFNLWVNLPTFSPSSVSQAEKRMKRDAGINILLGIGLLYAIPYGFSFIVEVFGTDLFENYHSLVWVVSLWAFLPALLVTRGISITKVSRILGNALKKA
ncbi:MAG: hypothetical protein L3J33_10905 [Rhodobacteraceae bacterium]|nr:hypothetical protein [Paracoccaceae bacterium]